MEGNRVVREGLQKGMMVNSDGQKKSERLLPGRGSSVGSRRRGDWGQCRVLCAELGEQSAREDKARRPAGLGTGS
jgi:hypothetical protein